MKANVSLSLTPIKQSVVDFFRRFHLIIFIIIVLGGATTVIFVLNSIIIESGDTSGSPTNTTDGTFDQSTIQRIEQLKTTDQASGQLNLSSGRTNPFVE